MKNNYKKLYKKEIFPVLCPSEQSQHSSEEEFIFNFRTTDVSECNELIAKRIQKLRRIKPEIDWCFCSLYSQILSTNYQPKLLNFAFCLCLKGDNDKECVFDDMFHMNFNRYASMVNFACTAKREKVTFGTRIDLKKWIIEFATILSTIFSVTNNRLGNEQSYDIFEKIADFAWRNANIANQDSEFDNEEFAINFIEKCRDVLDEELVSELEDPKAFFKLRCKNCGNFPINRILNELNKLDTGIYTIIFQVKKPKTKIQYNLVQTILERSKPKINSFIIYNEEKYLNNKRTIGLIAHLIGEYKIRL